MTSIIILYSIVFSPLCVLTGAGVIMFPGFQTIHTNILEKGWKFKSQSHHDLKCFVSMMKGIP